MYKKLIAIFAIYVALFPVNVLAQDAISSGNGALELWNLEGIANSPTWVQYWFYSMVTSLGLGIFFVKNHIESRWIVGGVIIGLLWLLLVTEIFGFIPYSGLFAIMHLIFWSPGLYLMLKNRPFLREKSI